jgi:hypothetical protein
MLSVVLCPASPKLPNGYRSKQHHTRRMKHVEGFLIGIRWLKGKACTSVNFVADLKA